ncbi:hypothetical protein L873DRAFT_1661010 [Choiromyces venosus 120613-1]|uniref:Uncharacterized protein n=1 Tax=Choiromyces venosus 120613-1 TaxID=1336337 RepID=A0A3N4KC70_9PEZI|nr:hypothetical protein L873DRAFT_1661010 [Choiromyces venosus 120613-1]
MDSFRLAIFSAVVPAKISSEQMSAPTAPARNSLGPVITPHPRIHIIEYQKMLLVRQQSVTQCGLGAFKTPTFLLNPSAAIHSKFENGRTHLPEIIIHPVESLAAGHVFNVNQEFFHMIKTGDGNLWRGWKGNFTPSNREDNAVKPSGSAFGQSQSLDGKEIYSWCKLDCCRRYFGSCKEQVGIHKVETPVEVEDGPEWWEIEDDDGEEDGVGYSSGDSEYDSDEDSGSDEESEEEESDDNDNDDEEEEDSDEEEEEEEENFPNFECCPVKLTASVSESSSTSSYSSFTMSDNSTPSTPPTVPCTPIMNSVDKQDLVEKYNLSQRVENALAAHVSYQQPKARVYRILPELDFLQQNSERRSLHCEWSGGNRGLEALNLEYGGRAMGGDVPITFLLSPSNSE